ncbi:MAG: alpha/beta hydrolase [Actinomycetota bacterium]|nr:alpha/beta hydrolase [Actinomycetota bacterium]
MATDPATETHLYWEARGSGPAILLVAGTPGDGGQFEAVVEELCADHLVITYDRRGTSRSARSPQWSETSVAEQTDDAASVLTRVGVSSALVFGTSNGAAVALELALRHPERVSRLVIHEIPLLSVLEEPAPVAAAIGSLIGGAMEAGGPRAALDAFLRFAFGNAVVDAWPSALRDRMLANADMVFSVEMPAFQAYRPDEDRLGACRVPATVLVGEDEQLPFFREAAGWLATRLGTTVDAAPGAHGPYFSAPAALASTLRHIEAGGDH